MSAHVASVHQLWLQLVLVEHMPVLALMSLAAVAV